MNAELIATPASLNYTNKGLRDATNKILALGDAIRKNWYEIAHVVAEVDKLGQFQEDGFDSVHAWTQAAFGLKKSASYTLLTIGKEYTRAVVNAKGRVTGYTSNLLPETASHDFNKSQIETLLPLGHDKALEMAETGRISPEMTVRDLRDAVKAVTQKPAQEPAQKPAPEPAQEPAQEPAPEPTQEPTPEPTQEPAPEPTQEPTQEVWTCETARDAMFDNVPTDVLIAELRARGFKVWRGSVEYIADWAE